MKKIYALLILGLLFMAGCESLEDTYKDYSGDGAVRYLGKCSDLSIEPGWNKLNVKWVNHIDPLIDKIYLVWATEGVVKDSLLDKTVSECIIPNLENANYEIYVCSVDKEGNRSLPVMGYGRPYTDAHETVRSFTRLIVKHYFIKDRLLLFFSKWNDNVTSATLEYTSGGKSKKLELTKDLLDGNKYYMLPDAIDEGTKVILNRSGRLEGCVDLIVFPSYELPRQKVYTPEFKQFIREKYGKEEISEDFITSLETLEFDYTMTSFEDILNISNLKILELGKNRFLKEEFLKNYKSDSKLYDIERSLFVLNAANEINGLEIKRYNSHYLPDIALPYMQEMGNPAPPVLHCMDSKDWKLSCSEEDEGNYNSHLDYLFDGDVMTNWQPELSTEGMRTYDIVVDFEKEIAVNGVKVVQKYFDPDKDDQSGKILPNTIKIKYSRDGSVWENAVYTENSMLGATSGETTVIRFPAVRNARYLKFVVNDYIMGSNFSVTLAEIGVF